MSSKTDMIRDVAEQAGVSQSTVSHVLNSSETRIRISQDTRQRVRWVVEELGHRPHPGARSLSGRGIGLLGLILREINDPFFAELIDVVSNAAKEEGYDLVLGNAKRELENASTLRDTMLDLRHCDDLLLCSDLRESREDHTFPIKMGRDHRLVSVSRGSKHLMRSTPSVDIDNRKGVFLVLDYLAQLGHQRIACMKVGRVGNLWERLETYGETMRDRSQPFATAPDRARDSCTRILRRARQLP